MSGPVRLHALTPEPVPEVVALLEDMLERAKAGEVIGVGVVSACRGRADGTAYALGEGSIASLVLACERLKLRLLMHEEG